MKVRVTHGKTAEFAVIVYEDTVTVAEQSLTVYEDIITLSE